MAEDLEALNKVIAEANMLKKQPHLKQRYKKACLCSVHTSTVLL